MFKFLVSKIRMYRKVKLHNQEDKMVKIHKMIKAYMMRNKGIASYYSDGIYEIYIR